MGAKSLNTSCRPLKIPLRTVRRFNSLSDIQLMEEYTRNCKQIADPLLFQEMVKRDLVSRGDAYRDVAELLYRLKTGN